MKLYFDRQSRFIFIDIEPRFTEFYGNKEHGFYLSVYDRKKKGHFATMYLRGQDEPTFSHEMTHFIYDLMREGYSEERVSELVDEVRSQWTFGAITNQNRS